MVRGTTPTTPATVSASLLFGNEPDAALRRLTTMVALLAAHDVDLDDNARRETLAPMTAGYSPVMIEHLFDEALVWALRRGAEALDWHDLQQAKMTEIGLRQPVECTVDERRRIATHEAGHATVAHLVGKDRKLEALSIIKRRDALGLLAHSDLEERFTKTRSEIMPRIQIAMGGLVAEDLVGDEILEVVRSAEDAIVDVREGAAVVAEAEAELERDRDRGSGAVDCQAVAVESGCSHIDFRPEPEPGGPAGVVDLEDDPLALADHAKDRSLEGAGSQVVVRHVGIAADGALSRSRIVGTHYPLHVVAVRIG